MVIEDGDETGQRGPNVPVITLQRTTLGWSSTREFLEKEGIQPPVVYKRCT